MRNVMVKKFIIKLFMLTDINDMILQGKKKQKHLDEKFWKEKLQDNTIHLNREHSLEIQELQAQISMLEDSIKVYKSKAKEVENKEYENRKCAKKNSFVATKMSTQIEDFAMSIMSIVGKMKGIKEEAEKNKLEITQR